MRRRPYDPRVLALAALMAALVFAMTLVRLFPTPPGGYIHLGDGGVNFAAFAFGPWVGGIVGGLGTALADVTGGYAYWALASFLIHGLQGIAVGWLSQAVRRGRTAPTSLGPTGERGVTDPPAAVPDRGRTQRFVTGIRLHGPETARLIFAATVGGLIVVLGYIPAGLIIAGEVAWAEVPWNVVQVLIGALIGIPLFALVRQAYPPLLRMGSRR
jgi:uncharacterized membrane protein